MKSENIPSAIVLCGGMSRRMGEDKGSMKFNEKPMIIHVLESISAEIDEVILVLNNSDRIAKYKSFIEKYIIDDKEKNTSTRSRNNKKSSKYDFAGFEISIIFVEDEIKDKGPLSGIMTGIKSISNEYSIVLPCDSPFVNGEYIKTMFNILDKNLAMGYNIDSIVPYHMDSKYLNHKHDNDDNKDTFVFKENEFFYNQLKDETLKEIILDNSEPLHSIYKKDNYKIIQDSLKSDKKQVKLLLKTINSFFIPIDNKIIKNINFKNINYKQDLVDN